MYFEIEVDMRIRIKRSFFYFKMNVIVEIKLLAKFDYCTIRMKGPNKLALNHILLTNNEQYYSADLLSLTLPFI